ncbi:MAG: glycosyltransferase family 4 protein [Armatimonadetes bacterium]|nr:glycosyltransferase family 4 protein [Armatimonadota bacterium]
MRLLLLTDRYLPEIRSSAHLFHGLARELQRRGHELRVITKVPAGYLEGERTSPLRPGWGEVDGVPVLRVRGFPIGGGHPIIRGMDHLTLGWSFGRASRQWPHADAVLVYSPPLPLMAAAAAYQRRHRAPAILNVQDIYPQTAIDLGLLRNRLAIALAEGVERRAYQRAVRVVVHSPGNRDYLVERKGLPADKVRVVYNWADTRFYRPGPRGNPFSREHGLDSKFVVSYAGVMGYAQDLSSVLECAARMAHEEDVLFLLVGEGVLEARWKKMVADRGLRNICFLPLQSQERYAQLLLASDVCLVPLDDNLRTPVVPGKLQSIMASGRPSLTIVNAGSDARRLVEESGGGINVHPGQPEALAEAIRRLKADPALRAEMGNRARAFAEMNFSLARCADAYEEVFAEASAGRS